MNSSIHHAPAPVEFGTDERCHIIEYLNDPADPDVSVARARVEPAVSTRWHRLKGVTERYAILSGQGRVELGEDGPVDVSAGDTVLIPPSCRQRITNTGDDDLVFLAICTPRFTIGCYEDVE